MRVIAQNSLTSSHVVNVPENKDVPVLGPWDLSGEDIIRLSRAVLSGSMDLVERGLLPASISTWVREFYVYKDVYEYCAGIADFSSGIKSLGVSPNGIALICLSGLKWVALNKVYSNPRLAPAAFLMNAFGTYAVSVRAFEQLKKCWTLGNKDNWQQVLKNVIVQTVNVSHSVYQTNSMYSLVMESKLEQGNRLIKQLKNDYQSERINEAEYSCRVLDLDCSKDLSEEKVKDAYRKQSIKFHPDKLPLKISPASRESSIESFREIGNRKDFFVENFKAVKRLSILKGLVGEILSEEELNRQDYSALGSGAYKDGNPPGARALKGACEVLPDSCLEINTMRLEKKCGSGEGIDIKNLLMSEGEKRWKYFSQGISGEGNIQVIGKMVNSACNILMQDRITGCAADNKLLGMQVALPTTSWTRR